MMVSPAAAALMAAWILGYCDGTFRVAACAQTGDRNRTAAAATETSDFGSAWRSSKRPDKRAPNMETFLSNLDLLGFYLERARRQFQNDRAGLLLALRGQS